MSTISDRVFYSQHIVECRWFHEASNDRTLEMSHMCKGYQTHKTVPGVRSTASYLNISAFADVGFQTLSLSPCSRANQINRHLDEALQQPNTLLPPWPSPLSQILHHQYGATRQRASRPRFPNMCRRFWGSQVGIHEFHASPACLAHGW